MTIAIITGMSTALLYWAHGIPILLGAADPRGWRAETGLVTGRKEPGLWHDFDHLDRDHLRPLPLAAGQRIRLPGSRGLSSSCSILYYALWAARNFAGPRSRGLEELMALEREVGELHHGELAPGGWSACRRPAQICRRRTALIPTPLSPPGPPPREGENCCNGDGGICGLGCPG